MFRVGYLEGTDPLFLNELVAREIDTIPLGNGVDNHGKFIGHITRADQITVVVGYLHKVMPLADSGLSALDIIHSCKVHRIPTLIIAQKALHAKAEKALGDAGDHITLVDPADLRKELDRVLG
ncbi:MAG TPA: hypothetical protein VGB22_02315 [candidate division Zixibacteria bacterium]|jgi:hypothetical protein